jgi:hypothetical protein
MSRRIHVSAPWPVSQLELLPRVRLIWGRGDIGIGFAWLNLWLHVWLRVRPESKLRLKP